MRTMNTRLRASGTALVAAALALTASACGGTTVEGEAPELTAETASPTSASSTPFAEERPEKPTSPVTPPPPPPSEPAPGEPEPAEPAPPEGEPAPGEPAPGEPVPPPPGTGDFNGVLGQGDVVMPAGIDPTATATEACRRFDDGQPMIDVTGWLGEHAQLNAEQQGFFLGAAVGTFCPHNFPKLG